MDRRELLKHKKTPKILPGRAIVFSRRHKLPKPLDRVVRSTRTSTTKLINVSDRHSVCFLFRDADIWTRSAFFGWLLHQQGKTYTAIAAFHYHPSHKSPHILMPCGEDDDLDHGTLHTCDELLLRDAETPPDPRTEEGRLTLIQLFCQSTGIQIKKDDSDDAAANQKLDLHPI